MLHNGPAGAPAIHQEGDHRFREASRSHWASVRRSQDAVQLQKAAG